MRLRNKQAYFGYHLLNEGVSVVSWLFTREARAMECCIIRGYEIIIRSDDNKRDTITA